MLGRLPIYEYRCGECGKRSSALLPRFDAPDPACPQCGKRALARLPSVFATVTSETGGDDLDDFGGDEGLDGGDDDFGGGGFDDDF
jgi:putative FmdB family regulatory protein